MLSHAKPVTQVLQDGYFLSYQRDRFTCGMSLLGADNGATSSVRVVFLEYRDCRFIYYCGW
jgi:hypothetical protein